MNDSQSSIPEYYPEVILRKLIIDREEVNLNRFYSADRKQILLSEEQNTFSLQFVALDYLNSDIEYAYILEGYDEKWSLFSKENEAMFKNVPPGEYLLRIRYKKVSQFYSFTYSCPVFLVSECRSPAPACPGVPEG